MLWAPLSIECFIGALCMLQPGIDLNEFFKEWTIRMVAEAEDRLVDGAIVDQESRFFRQDLLKCRRFGWLLGELRKDRWIRVDAIYEPPQCGFSQRFLLRTGLAKRPKV